MKHGALSMTWMRRFVSEGAILMPRRILVPSCDCPEIPMGAGLFREHFS